MKYFSSLALASAILFVLPGAMGYRRIRADDVSLLPQYNAALAQRLVNQHNQVRSHVSPPAQNMLKMEWNQEASSQAQQWADQCRGGHNHKSQRRTKHHSTCGQNVLRTFNGPFSWDSVLKIWSADEAPHFRYGQPGNNMGVVGHYVQMIWATTFQVGCGYRNCGNFQLYVCHYCPSGNFVGEEMHPYKSGRSCAACAGSCERGLCSNSCPYTNVYSNCDQVASRYQICSNPSWAAVCGASCKCKGKIYD